eukprot:3577286-Rhodomonas_salina.1
MVASAANEAEFAAATAGKNGVVAYFWAAWAPMCTQTDQLCDRLSSECKNVTFVKIDADQADVRSSTCHRVRAVSAARVTLHTADLCCSGSYFQRGSFALFRKATMLGVSLDVTRGWLVLTGLDGEV